MLTDDELQSVLRKLESKIDTIGHVVERIAERVFNDEERRDEPLAADLAECHHDLRAVARLDQTRGT